MSSAAAVFSIVPPRLLPFLDCMLRQFGSGMSVYHLVDYNLL